MATYIGAAVLPSRRYKLAPATIAPITLLIIFSISLNYNGLGFYFVVFAEF